MDQNVEKVAGYVRGLHEILQKYPSEVSGGQKPRSAGTRAFSAWAGNYLGESQQQRLILKMHTSFTLDCDAQTLNKDQGVSIMMLRMIHIVASYCQAYLFIQDGELYKEFIGGGSGEEFYKKF